MAIRSVKTGLFSRSMLVGNNYYIPPAFDSIASNTLSVDTATVTFSSIPGTYQHLQLRIMARGTKAADTGNPIRIQFNSDTGTNYVFHRLVGNGSAASSAAGTSQAAIQSARIPESSAATDVFGVQIVDIHDYASSTKNKTTRTFGGVDNNEAVTGYQIHLGSGLWLSTSAITSITLAPTSNNFKAGSTFALYGIKGA